MEAIIEKFLKHKDFEETYVTDHGIFPSDIQVPKDADPFVYINQLQKIFIDTVECYYPDFWEEVVSFEFVLNRKRQVMFVIEK